MSKKRSRNEEEEEEDNLFDTSSSSSSSGEEDVPLNPLGLLMAEEEEEEEVDEPANYKRIKLDALGSMAISLQQMANTLERTLQQVEKISKNSESLLFMRK